MLAACAEEEEEDFYDSSYYEEQNRKAQEKKKEYLSDLSQINEKHANSIEARKELKLSDLKIEELETFIEEQRKIEEKLRDKISYYYYDGSDLDNEIREQSDILIDHIQNLSKEIESAKGFLKQRKDEEYERKQLEARKLRDQNFIRENRRDFDLFSKSNIKVGITDVSNMNFCDLLDEREGLVKYIDRVKRFREKIWRYKYLNEEDKSKLMNEMKRIVDRFVSLEDELAWRGEDRYEVNPRLEYFSDNSQNKKDFSDREKDVLFFYERNFEYEIPHHELSKEEFLLRQAQLEYLHLKIEHMQANLLLNFIAQVFAADSFEEAKRLYKLSKRQKNELESLNRSFHFCW